MAKSYKDLIAWQKAMTLVGEVYKLSECFPRHEIFGLTSQLRRAAVSIPSNIAEGQARFSKREFNHFLLNSRGSLAEVETQVLIAAQLGYLGQDRANHVLELTNELGRVMNGLITSLSKTGVD